MKKTISTALLFIISAVLVLSGVLYGSYKGWREESARVTMVYESADGLKNMLSYRANDGANLEKVALRHVDKNDAQLQAVLECRAVLLSESATLHDKFLANQRLSETSGALIASLSKLPSVVASQRDQSYLKSIERDLNLLNQSSAASMYNEAAHDYNTRLNRSLGGRLFAHAAPLFQ